MPLRLIFMGTPDFSVPTLRELVAHGHEVAAVYTRAPKPGGRGQHDGIAGGGVLERVAINSNHALRHARACRGHPRLNASARMKTWMAGTSPAMTVS